jgi:hypothetical protein
VFSWTCSAMNKKYVIVSSQENYFKVMERVESDGLRMIPVFDVLCRTACFPGDFDSVYFYKLDHFKDSLHNRVNFMIMNDETKFSDKIQFQP